MSANRFPPSGTNGMSGRTRPPYGGPARRYARMASQPAAACSPLTQSPSGPRSTTGPPCATPGVFPSSANAQPANATAATSAMQCLIRELPFPQHPQARAGVKRMRPPPRSGGLGRLILLPLPDHLEGRLILHRRHDRPPPLEEVQVDQARAAHLGPRQRKVGLQLGP